jgi:hypothetical protein
MRGAGVLLGVIALLSGVALAQQEIEDAAPAETAPVTRGPSARR